MNGARSTLMRKGYWLTALAAAVLLAASSGTAYAQATITAPKTVNEGDSATVTVTLKGSIAAGKANDPIKANTATVTAKIEGGTATPPATKGEVGDISTNLGLVATFEIPANATTSAVSYSATRAISVQTNHDTDAEDELFDWTFTLVDGNLTVGADKKKLAIADGSPTTLTIKDDETQTYVFTVTTKDPKEGSPINVTLGAVPAHVEGKVVLTLHSDNPKYGIDKDFVTVDDKTPAFTVTTPGNDGNRVADSVTLTAHSGSAGNSMQEASVTIDVADANALPAVAAMVVDKAGKVLAPQPKSVTEGKSLYVAVMPVDKNGKAMKVAEKLTVALTPTGTADAADYTLVRTITIDKNTETSAAVELEVRADEDVGTDTLMFDAVVSGEAANGTETSTSAGVLLLTIVDATATKIAPKAEADAYPKITGAIKAGSGDDEVLNPGETVEILTSDLFALMAGYTASYGASVEGDSVSASTSGEMVTLNALMAGESKVTITGTAKAGASSFMPDQAVSNVASITFAVMVVDKVLAVTLEMPANVMNGNIVEGKSYDIMVSANRMITEAEGSVEVMIMRDRAKSDADDSDFTVSSATIMAGKDSATAELMVTEDMLPDSGTNDNMGEALVLYGMAGDMETNELTFTIWDQAVPALPLFGQLLLALFLMLGGARLYRRRQG